jgi:hypothetical protein
MRMLQFLLVIMALVAVPAFGQTVIESFDTPNPDSAFFFASEGAPTYIRMTQDLADKQEGIASTNIRTAIGAFHGWGSFSQIEARWPSGTVVDISISDSVSIWIKVTEAPKIPANMVMRIHLVDSTDGTREDWLYENATILDAVSDWVNLKIPLTERVSDGSTVPSDAGFVYAPTNWGGFTYNNKKFDRDKIVGWKIAFVTSGWDPGANLPADSLEFKLDGFQRFGLRAVPAVMFNGRDYSPQITNKWAWGQSSITLELNAGPLPKTNAIKWTQGNEWGNGWTGIGFDINPGFNLAGGWVKDSLKFKMKAEAGVGALRVQFESPRLGDPSQKGKVGVVFTPTADGAWHDYIFALRNMVYQDGTTGFDSSNVNTFGIMAEASGIAGKVIYITDLWTGVPEFDVIPPDAPSGLAGAGTGYVNLVTWNDVPNEPGIRYNVYFADHPWTAVDDSTVEDLPPYNITSAVATHPLRVPKTDANLTYYYGVVSKDPAGNESSPVIMTTPVTTLAKGVPTISKTGPATFTADGDLSEWSTITPFVLSTVSGTAHAVPNFPITGDNDLSATAYVAMDATYLYVAFDVTDDVVLVDIGATDYEQDCADIFVGLYDWRGKRHSGYTRGATPDYHLRFSKHRIWLDNGGKRVDTISADYAWTEKLLSPGYVSEARIRWTDLAALHAGDALFSPVEGMRIPIDFAINDRDTKATRDGIMCYSTLTNDNSWSDMFYWTYTWIGDKSSTVGVEQVSDVATSFELGQNYPNPFNPTTEIRYSVPTSGPVSLRVYDMMGREVETLVDRTQDAGSYVVTFNADRSGRSIASGVYFLRLEAGANAAIRKMLLVK